MANATQFTDLQMTVDGITVTIPAPYVTPEEWAKRTGMELAEVKNRLRDNRVFRYQAVSRGMVLVNVVQEMKRAIQAKPY